MAEHDLSALSISQLHALYEAAKHASSALLGFTNQPRISGRDAEDIIDTWIELLDRRAIEVAREMRRRPRPLSTTMAGEWAAIIILDEMTEAPRNGLLSLAEEFAATPINP